MLTDIVFIDEFTRGEHPVVMQFFIPFCGHFVSNFYFTVKKWLLELINNTTELLRRPALIREGAPPAITTLLFAWIFRKTCYEKDVFMLRFIYLTLLHIAYPEHRIY